MLEVACFDISSAIVAAEAGADRIELCADYVAGGVTPSPDCVQSIRKETTKPINVMIRPRPGNFTYSEIEYEQMKADVHLFKPEASGFVFGILDEQNRVDKARNRELIELAAPLPCTFHRAFDQVLDLSQATQHLIECGFTSVLTSGGQPDAVRGADKVAGLHKEYGNRISFILGGGIRSMNIDALRATANVEWYHSAAITKPGEVVDGDEVRTIQAILAHTA
ncbi:hypothetical protein BU26DRAFT_188784 [Trematosphaeria pertusa]|uniref:Copper homeostasis protein cutC homolog n=1 Tax=Trematosphaeria pertusa TaxID=390896 RepID=A0A6A6HSJ9_9PLEO|nr:uncharacterized protein BU26DRAFT_188784 [Trematosphaeria pertusa]KAF2240758.1 hypothetical protein BU26DRAFT_188784 [Trematosphaeria pertusa]